MAKTRIAKKPDARRSEIIAAAEELFLAQGFEETTVSDIVNKVGVAQGLFYYYFKSKDEILDEVVELLADSFMTELNSIANDDRLDAIQKMRTILAGAVSLMTQKEKLFIFIHQERNELLHYRLAQKFINKATPFFAQIIEEGVREKLFDVEYPRETAEVLLAGAGQMPSMFRLPQDLAHYFNKTRAALTVMEKTLGAPKGSLQIDLPDLKTTGPE